MTAATDAVDQILSGYESIQAAQEAFHKDLHAHPELSHHEHRTAGRVAAELAERGCAVQAGIGGTGVVGLLANGDGAAGVVADGLVTPGDTAVVTVGAVQAGARGNVIGDHAVLQLNLRSYSDATRQRMLDAIKRIVRGECEASGSPREPEFETVASFPPLDNDTAVTDRVAAAFTVRFGQDALDITKQTVSEDFGLIPASVGAPYSYWGIGRTDRQAYLAAEQAGRLQDLPSNHSPNFLPPLRPTLRTGTEAMVTAAMAWLGPH